MSSSDSESTLSDITDASEKSVVGSPVIQDLDIIISAKTDAECMMIPKSTKDPDGKTTQMIATNSLSASASTAQMIAASNYALL